jgi:glycine cleavage system H protein
MEAFELLYAKTHEWLGIIDKTDLAYVGVSQFALEQLTDIVWLGLPDVGETISKGESFGEVESVKAVSDLFAPVDGEIVEINQTGLDDPASLMDNDDPWLIKIKIKNPDVSHLMTQGQYEEQIKDDG